MQNCAKVAARAEGKGCIARAEFFYFCPVSFILFFLYQHRKLTLTANFVYKSCKQVAKVITFAPQNAGCIFLLSSLICGAKVSTFDVGIKIVYYITRS